ncbi:MAG TPA: tetratricopeptide repeat protein [Blastocatellia bacterium]|nr:tetratricopeptide repeat protein [Blastocatellia bacterium]
MKRLASLLLVFLLSCSFKGAAQEVSLERAQTLLKHGAYKQAAEAFTTLLQKNSSGRDAQLGLAAALFESGDYSGVEKRVKEFLSAQPSDAALRVWLGEVELETGRYSESASEFERAARDAKGAVWLRAMLGRARALIVRGKEEEAQPILQEIVRYYSQNSPRSAEELTLIARAVTYLGMPKDANELFIDAREADPSFIDAFIGQGELFNDTYNYGDAASLFQDAFKVNESSPGAQVGFAECRRLESSEEPVAAVKRALAVNPNYVKGLVLLAWLDLEAEKTDESMKSIDRALAINQYSVEAIAMRAAVFYLQDRKADLDGEIKRALAINPHAGQLYDTLAHFAVNNRRYTEAVDFGRRALELAPKLWSTRTELGIQLLRVGRIAEGRAELERAFAGDPFNFWAKNTLDLLDSMRDYQDTIRGPFLVKSAPKETGAFSVYAADLLEEAHKKLTAKYRFTPRGPISVEVFPNHEDFAVRSLGLPGLGALGVCFGQVIAMDSPSARPLGQFNWGSTLWHEFTHVITLQITDHRIPRWFSEGLSVYEERRARPGWGDNWSVENVKAFSEGRFVKIEDLDGAFTRPRSPDGVTLAYFQASQVCEFVEEKAGFDAILKMLALYKDGGKTQEVLQKALSMSPADFDRAFTDYLKSKTATWVEALGHGPVAVRGAQPPSKEALTAILKARPNDYFAHLRLGTIYKTEGDSAHAIEELRRASEVFPFYGGEGNPYGQLAEIYESRGEKREAIAALESLIKFNETDNEALKKLARLRSETGDRKGALEALATSFYIYPFDADLHKQAGAVYLEEGRPTEAVREFGVVVSLNPPDAAGAHYDLARSLEASGNRAEAKREVLRSLEMAPGFEKAQELLLRLRGGPKP